MGTPLSVEIEDDGEPFRITVKGELDLSTAGRLEAALARAAGERDVALDLSGLSFIDSSGIRILVLANARQRKRGHRLTLQRCSAVCIRTFEVAGLRDELDFESEDAPDAQP